MSDFFEILNFDEKNYLILDDVDSPFLHRRIARHEMDINALFIGLNSQSKKNSDQEIPEHKNGVYR